MEWTVRKASSFAVLMGLLMFATWLVIVLLAPAPLLTAKPLESALLLVAEGLTAGALIAGGYGASTGRKWGLTTLLVALGMLQYCVVFSIGVFAQAGIVLAVAWFILVAALTAFFIVRFLVASSGATA